MSNKDNSSSKNDTDPQNNSENNSEKQLIFKKKVNNTKQIFSVFMFLRVDFYSEFIYASAENEADYNDQNRKIYEEKITFDDLKKINDIFKKCPDLNTAFLCLEKIFKNESNFDFFISNQSFIIIFGTQTNPNTPSKAECCLVLRELVSVNSDNIVKNNTEKNGLAANKSPSSNKDYETRLCNVENKYENINSRLREVEQLWLKFLSTKFLKKKRKRNSNKVKKDFNYSGDSEMSNSESVYKSNKNTIKSNCSNDNLDNKTRSIEVINITENEDGTVLTEDYKNSRPKKYFSHKHLKFKYDETDCSKQLKKLNSAILKSSKEVKLLFEEISYKNQAKIKDLRLLYKATVHKDTAESFHQKVDGKNQIIVLILTKGSKRFGLYTSNRFLSRACDCKDKRAFLFSLDLMKTYSAIDKSKKGCYFALNCNPKSGPRMVGKNIWTNDNFFTNLSETGLKGKNFETTEDFEINGGDQFFLVKEMEVYKVLFDMSYNYSTNENEGDENVEANISNISNTGEEEENENDEV